MADVKISGLSAVASVVGAQEYVVNDAGTSKKATATQAKVFNQIGTTTNDNAVAGSIGELATASLAFADRITLTTATAANVISVSLTAGDWDVSGVVTLEQGGSINVKDIFVGISTTSATLPTDDSHMNVLTYGSAGASLGGSSNPRMPTPPARISIGSTTTVYLVVLSTFTADTLKAYGTIRARRVR